MKSINEIQKFQFDDTYEMQKYIERGGLNGYQKSDFDFQLIIRRKNEEPRDPDIFADEFDRFLEDTIIEVDVESDEILKNIQERIEKINPLIYPQKIIIEDQRTLNAVWDAILYIESEDIKDKSCILRMDFVKKPNKTNYSINIYNNAETVPFSISALEKYFLSERFLKDLNNIRNLEKKRKERITIFRNSFIEKSNRHIIYITPGYILGTIGTLFALFWSVALVVLITLSMIIINIIVRYLNKKQSLNT